MRSDKARLRTRFGESGMDYKGYNIAVHELGHTVEQTLSLNKVDSYLMRGVPNNAFTEAFAYVFQDRDLELLGLKVEDPQAAHLKALMAFWNSYEIMGVALVDMYAWNWLYRNPGATAQYKEAVNSIARDVWNKYYAPVLGVRDQAILAIYSHMIDYTLYLPHYAVHTPLMGKSNVGPTLRPFLYGEQIGQTLLAKGKVEPQLVCTNVEPMLSVREFSPTPVVLVMTDAAPIAEPLVPLTRFSLGTLTVAVPAAYEEDRAEVQRRWQASHTLLDLNEPFARIREAIEEARKAAA